MTGYPQYKKIGGFTWRGKLIEVLYIVLKRETCLSFCEKWDTSDGDSETIFFISSVNSRINLIEKIKGKERLDSQDRLDILLLNREGLSIIERWYNEGYGI